MKSNKKLLLLVTSLFSLSVLTGCFNRNKSSSNDDGDDSAQVEPKVLSLKLYAGDDLIVKGKTLALAAVVETQGSASKLANFASSDPSVATVDDSGVVTGVKVGEVTITATAKDDASKKDSLKLNVVDPTLADGAYSYAYASGEERTEILGKLEKFAVESKLTGLTLYGDGGYVLYNPSVVKGTNNYVPGFGFGILSSGSLNADLEGETNANWKRYYHTFETSDPQNLNYMDDKGAVVGDLIGYVSAGYYTTYLNAEGNGYDWVGDLATNDRPIPIDQNPDTGMASKYKIPVKVGSQLKYSTLSSKYASFNNREVALEDYITPYKIYYTKAYGLARSAENLTGSSSIKGSSAYYEKSEEGFNAEAWANIGIGTLVEGGQSFITFEFNQACTPFYAMYYLSSSMFAPVPEDFIKAIGNND